MIGSGRNFGTQGKQPIQSGLAGAIALAQAPLKAAEASLVPRRPSLAPELPSECLELILRSWGSNLVVGRRTWSREIIDWSDTEAAVAKKLGLISHEQARRYPHRRQKQQRDRTHRSASCMFGW